MIGPLKRDLIVVVDGKEYRDPLKITAKVVKDAAADDPDFAEVRIFNLRAASRSSMGAIDGIRCSPAA